VAGTVLIGSKCKVTKKCGHHHFHITLASPGHQRSTAFSLLLIDIYFSLPVLASACMQTSRRCLVDRCSLVALLCDSLLVVVTVVMGLIGPSNNSGRLLEILSRVYSFYC